MTRQLQHKDTCHSGATEWERVMWQGPYDSAAAAQGQLSFLRCHRVGKGVTNCRAWAV